MKPIAGAILMFAAVNCVAEISPYLVYSTPDKSGLAVFVLGGAAVLNFLLGLYFLFFAKDKPNN